MRFKEAYEGWHAGKLTQIEAARLLGMCSTRAGTSSTSIAGTGASTKAAAATRGCSRSQVSEKTHG